jgi:co-chaperonin GroES (HSP10)
MKFKPLGKYIVIKTVEEELITASGLRLSKEDAAQMRYKKGLVIKPGTEVDPKTGVSEGDSIYYDKRAGFMMLIDNQPYTVIVLADVVVVL